MVKPLTHYCCDYQKKYYCNFTKSMFCNVLNHFIHLLFSSPGRGSCATNALFVDGNEFVLPSFSSPLQLSTIRQIKYDVFGQFM